MLFRSREYGFHTSMIESSMMINDRMPEYCVERAGKILNRFQKALNGARILLLGVAYKQDIDDYRESPALKVFEEFEKMGSKVEFFDPYISSYRFKGKVHNGIEKIDEDVLSSYDLVVITTAHSSVDYDMVARASKVVFDTKNAMKGVKDKSRIEVL